MLAGSGEPGPANRLPLEMPDRIQPEVGISVSVIASAVRLPKPGAGLPPPHQAAARGYDPDRVAEASD